ncbi:hypothetical protein PAV_5c01910 [Paenibacillus alvei DSM 29]|uniref:DUF4214 domain-containing protein n=1 Tax=Paenibacillus alvei TaxID=44250 RepID=UPI00028A0B17|nr:DUF4214 domain-containing protein [Paenibacillus alvei]EJW16609.1 hypothetical protein PAV_5c01910 [Paenibacillus alvei DSM 29]
MNIIQTLHQMFRLEEEAFVSELYRQVLNREPDLSGLSHFVGLLRAGHTKLTIMIQFMKSKELKQALTREGRIDMGGHLYVSFIAFIPY